jgi:hypothetical protein
MVSKKVLVFGLVFFAVVAAGDLWGAVKRARSAYAQEVYVGNGKTVDQTCPIRVRLDRTMANGFRSDGNGGLIAQGLNGTEIYQVSVMCNVAQQAVEKEDFEEDSVFELFLKVDGVKVPTSASINGLFNLLSCPLPDLSSTCPIDALSMSSESMVRVSKGSVLTVWYETSNGVNLKFTDVVVDIIAVN